MPVEAVLINGPAIDFNTFLSVTHQAISYSIASAADSSGRKMVDTEKFLMCLAAFKDQTAETITATLLCHVSFSVLVIADERDLLEILEMASGMAFVRAETTVPDVDIVVITGTLLHWKHAVVSGTSEAIAPTVRACYSKIFLLFDRAGLISVWKDYHRTTARDRSGLLLEDMRK
jgi:hypothetical protein